MEEQKKTVAVVTKLTRDPFADFRPAAWKRPFYFLEDRIERSLSEADWLITFAIRKKREARISLTLAFYILLVVIICATLVSLEINKIGLLG